MSIGSASCSPSVFDRCGSAFFQLSSLTLAGCWPTACFALAHALAGGLDQPHCQVDLTGAERQCALSSPWLAQQLARELLLPVLSQAGPAALLAVKASLATQIASVTPALAAVVAAAAPSAAGGSSLPIPPAATAAFAAIVAALVFAAAEAQPQA